jgi:hypothetical protein
MVHLASIQQIHLTIDQTFPPIDLRCIDILIFQ